MDMMFGYAIRFTMAKRLTQPERAWFVAQVGELLTGHPELGDSVHEVEMDPDFVELFE